MAGGGVSVCMRVEGCVYVCTCEGVCGGGGAHLSVCVYVHACACTF